jgi:hypothetical protein
MKEIIFLSKVTSKNITERNSFQKYIWSIFYHGFGDGGVEG